MEKKSVTTMIVHGDHKDAYDVVSDESFDFFRHDLKKRSLYVSKKFVSLPNSCCLIYYESQLVLGDRFCQHANDELNIPFLNIT